MACTPKPDEPPPPKLYLLSFGDTMTALLAFFIVLLSLAEEQTGANMHTGTGSFVRAFDGAGLPGAFSGDTTARAVQHDEVSPLYMTDEPDEEHPPGKGTGPEDDNGIPVVDREEDIYQRFLNELERLNQVERLPETEGEAVFDLFNKFSASSPLLTQPHKDAIMRVLPTLRHDNYRVDIIVWASMPSPQAWKLASERAVRVLGEIQTWARLRPDTLSRLRVIGKPWRFSNVKRPIMSIVVRKVSVDKT